ncbi:MAG: hypothetical protein ACI90V_003112, partial [Bacillariaceae sp.]
SKKGLVFDGDIILWFPFFFLKVGFTNSHED